MEILEILFCVLWRASKIYAVFFFVNSWRFFEALQKKPTIRFKKPFLEFIIWIWLFWVWSMYLSRQTFNSNLSLCYECVCSCKFMVPFVGHIHSGVVRCIGLRGNEETNIKFLQQLEHISTRLHFLFIWVLENSFVSSTFGTNISGRCSGS